MYSPVFIYNQNLQRIENFCKLLRPRPVAIILTVLGLLTFSNAIFHPFVHDDVIFIQQNPHIADLNPAHIIRQTFLPDQNSLIVNTYYRPFLEFFNRLQYQIFRLNPAGYHFMNILLHILNSILLYNVMYVARQRTRKPIPSEEVSFYEGWDRGFAFITAVIFLIHPAQSEAVACIAGISNVLSLFFGLIIFYLYLISSDPQKRQAFLLYSLSLFLYALALLSKEQVVILPFLIVLYELCFKNQRPPLLRGGLRIAGYFVLVIGYFLLRKALFGHALTPWIETEKEFSLRMLAMPRTFLTYFGILFFPHDLHYYRCIDILKPFLGPLIFFSFLVIFMGILIKCVARQQRTWIFFGLGWFLISILPVINIVPLINEYSLLLTAEHFLYWPIIGMTVFVLSLCEHWMGRVGKLEALYLLLMILISTLIIFFFITVTQNTYWRSEIPLFERTVRFERNFARARILLAKAYGFKNRHDDAIRQYNLALPIMQRYADSVQAKPVKSFYLGFVKDIYLDLAHCYEAMGAFGKSPEYYLKAAEVDPEDAVIFNNLGFNFLKLKDFNKATEYFEKAVKLKPDDLMMKNSLALVYKETGRLEEAEKLLREIAAKDPQSASAQQNLENFLSSRENP